MAQKKRDTARVLEKRLANLRSEREIDRRITQLEKRILGRYARTLQKAMTDLQAMRGQFAEQISADIFLCSAVQSIELALCRVTERGFEREHGYTFNWDATIPHLN